MLTMAMFFSCALKSLYAQIESVFKQEIEVKLSLLLGDSSGKKRVHYKRPIKLLSSSFRTIMVRDYTVNQKFKIRLVD